MQRIRKAAIGGDSSKYQTYYGSAIKGDYNLSELEKANLAKIKLIQKQKRLSKFGIATNPLDATTKGITNSVNQPLGQKISTEMESFAMYHRSIKEETLRLSLQAPMSPSFSQNQDELSKEDLSPKTASVSHHKIFIGSANLDHRTLRNEMLSLQKVAPQRKSYDLNPQKILALSDRGVDNLFRSSEFKQGRSFYL